MLPNGERGRKTLEAGRSRTMQGFHEGRRPGRRCERQRLRKIHLSPANPSRRMEKGESISNKKGYYQ